MDTEHVPLRVVRELGGQRVADLFRAPLFAFYSSALLADAAAASPPPKIIMTWPVYGIDNGSGWQQTP